MWLDQVGKGEDDALLSTSRQGAQAVMAGLQTPTEEGGTIAELYRFLYSGTPAAQKMAAGAAAAAATAATGQPGPVAPWRDSMQGMPQQQLQQLPASSSAGCMGQQQQQQQMYPSAGYSWAPQDAAAGAAFLQMQQQQQPAGRMVPPPGMHYSQPQLQQPVHVLSKLSRTVSGFDSVPHNAASMLQPSLPDAMMLRQSLPPPQPRFVPQAPPQGTTGMGGMGPAGAVMGHNNAAVITAAGGFQPAPRPAGQMQGPDPQQQQHMMYRQHMPVLSQQQPPAPHLMPQEPLPPQHIQPQQQQQLMRPMHADMQAPAAHHQGFAAPPPSHPPTSWNAEDLRQLLDILHADGAGAEGQVPVLGPPPALYHIPHHPVVDECKLEHANNVTGSLTAAT